MNKWDGLNRRQFPRVNYPCLVIIRDASGDEGNALLTHTENVGIGGVCLTLKQNVKMFSSVDIEIDLLDLGEHIKCKGKVVWNVRRKREETHKPLFYDIGIEFEGLAARDQQRLKDIIARLITANEKSSRKK